MRTPNCSSEDRRGVFTIRRHSLPARRGAGTPKASRLSRSTRRRGRTGPDHPRDDGQGGASSRKPRRAGRDRPGTAMSLGLPVVVGVLVPRSGGDSPRSPNAAMDRGAAGVDGRPDRRFADRRANHRLFRDAGRCPGGIPGCYRISRWARGCNHAQGSARGSSTPARPCVSDARDWPGLEKIAALRRMEAGGRAAALNPVRQRRALFLWRRC